MTFPLGYTVSIHDGAVTESGNTRSAPVETRYIKEGTFFLDVTALSGTLDLEIQTYNPLTTNWHKLATFDQISEIGKDEGFIQHNMGEKIALKYVVSGSATFTLDVHLK